MNAVAPLVQVDDLAKTFDVSPPWLNRVLERKPRQFVHAVDGVSFAIRKGTTLALVGESGCGKSTVARLLVGLYEPTRGSVHFDGQDTGALKASAASLRGLRRRMQMIFQDPYASLNPRWKVLDIIGEPLREHGLCSTPDSLRQKVGELLRSVGLAAADMEKFPHQFSGGQRQRIAIARVMLKDAPILLLDEATSALDSEVEAAIQASLYRLMEGKTVVAIAHRLSTIAAMDRLVVLDKGRIVEMGDHAALLAQGGLYARLWAHQSGGFLVDEDEPEGGNVAGDGDARPERTLTVPPAFR